MSAVPPHAVLTTHAAGDRAMETALARRLDVPRVVWFASVSSTMDEAHVLAHGGAPAGTVVVADAQTSGRGRSGKSWLSADGAGIWTTVIERPLDPSSVDALSLRVGLRSAAALDRFVDAPVRLKWPNDLMLPEGKLGGILVEARWREGRPEWVAIGVGINLTRPGVAGGAALRDGTARDDVLGELIPAVRAAAAASGALSGRELREYAARDWALGRRVVSPYRGTVAGISPAGAVLIETPEGTVSCASGSLVFEGVTT